MDLLLCKTVKFGFCWMVGQVVLLNNVLERSSFLHQERAFADEILLVLQTNHGWNLIRKPEEPRPSTIDIPVPVSIFHIYYRYVVQVPESIKNFHCCDRVNRSVFGVCEID